MKKIILFLTIFLVPAIKPKELSLSKNVKAEVVAKPVVISSIQKQKKMPTPKPKKKKRDPFAPPRAIITLSCKYLGNAECNDEQYAFVEWKKDICIVNPGHVFDDVWEVCTIAKDFIELKHKDGDIQKINICEE